MRLPVRHIANNIIWTTLGTCWAIWRVEAANFSHAPHAAKKRRLEALEALFKSLTGEPMLLSLCPQVDPVTVVRAMVADVDLARSPRYEQLGHTVLDQLETMELTGRTDWLAIPLPNLSFKDGLLSVLASARAELALQLGLLPAAVGTREVEQRTAQAARMQAQWPSGVVMRPAGEAEILWIYGHSARRGVVEPLLPDDAAHKASRRGRTAAGVGQTLLAEGGADTRRTALPANPFNRRYLQVTTEAGSSFQALLALSEMPAAFALPGAAYLQQLDDLDYPVDWSVRLHITPGVKAEPKIRRRTRVLEAQAAEYEGDPAGPPAAIEENKQDNQELGERLSTSQREVELRAMVTLAVWGTSADEAQERAQSLAADFGATGYTFNRPVGEQSALWHGMLPGCRTPRVLLGYAQYLLAKDFAMSMPWSGQVLGDERGGLYGWQVVSGGIRPVLLDASRGPREDASGSMAFIGELGAGKSTGEKAAVYNVLARGHQPGRPPRGGGWSSSTAPRTRSGCASRRPAPAPPRSSA